ncbi:MAG: acyl-CoA thioesterase domain-containing protein [Actinomycetota bacterium]|nr:acyl-CoA thioesterase domain-containing protein [Actinomycetota bacterium]MED5553242.1 acyl-CoA thioesterase domain-containing protein [Actinomycetota bacterium]MEE3187172.1 acyl-CoA thioesterase domain-containing protein [Actinomycetota bacterium]
MTDPKQILRLEPHGADAFVGESPAYEWGRIYGGLVIAQALRAAMFTVDIEGHSVHSLHAYFILGGDPNEPVRYEVDRLRNGRSFSTRRVVARQSGGAILNLSCSFQREEDGPDVSTSIFPVDVKRPEESEPIEWGIGLDARLEHESTHPARHRVWARFSDTIGDSQDDHYAALAYLSDTNAMDAVVSAHPAQSLLDDKSDELNWEEMYMAASLDHAVWFHRAVRADEWLLFDLSPHQLKGTRGLATGDVFTEGGELVATVAQQGLVRLRDTTS